MISPMTAQQLMAAGQTEEKITHQITIRYRTNLTPRMRLRYGNRLFEIKNILDPLEEHRELDILCEEIVQGQVST